MKRTPWILAILVAAQTVGAAHASRQPSRQALDEWVTTAEEHLVGVAEAMPADKYSFTPTGGEFTGVRTFGQQLKHVAANNYAMSARIVGAAPAADQVSEAGPDSVTTK